MIQLTILAAPSQELSSSPMDVLLLVPLFSLATLTLKLHWLKVRTTTTLRTQMHLEGSASRMFVQVSMTYMLGPMVAKLATSTPIIQNLAST